MFKVLIALSALVLAVYCAPPQGWPNGKQYKDALTAAGISSQAANGIIRIGNNYASQQQRNDNDAARLAFHDYISEVETFIKTQSSADQAAYHSFIAQKKVDFDAQHAGQK